MPKEGGGVTLSKEKTENSPEPFLSMLSAGGYIYRAATVQVGITKEGGKESMGSSLILKRGYLGDEVAILVDLTKDGK